MVTLCSYSMEKIIASIVILLFSFITITQGSCWRYGHACWGGHGKRSGLPLTLTSKELPLRDSHEEQKLPIPIRIDNEFLELSHDPSLNFNLEEPNQSKESEEKDTVIDFVDDDQTDSIIKTNEQTIEEDEGFSQIANRNKEDEIESDMSNGSGEENISFEEQRQDSLPQFTNSIVIPQRNNQIVYKLLGLNN